MVRAVGLWLRPRQRSSRAIERGCVETSAYRVIAANRQPDRTTIARFRQRHETALARCSGRCWRSAAQAGLAGVESSRSDGTKVHATRRSARLATHATGLRRSSGRRDDRREEDPRFGDRAATTLDPPCERPPEKVMVRLHQRQAVLLESGIGKANPTRLVRASVCRNGRLVAVPAWHRSRAPRSQVTDRRGMISNSSLRADRHALLRLG